MCPPKLPRLDDEHLLTLEAIEVKPFGRHGMHSYQPGEHGHVSFRQCVRGSCLEAARTPGYDGHVDGSCMNSVIYQFAK